MKEKSKDAAKTRREKENQGYADLARLLPIPSAIAAQLDKASQVRLTTSYLRLRCVFPEGFEQACNIPRSRKHQELKELASNLMQSLEGFVFVLSVDGLIMYISETASVHFGMSQVELIGNSIYDYVHKDDQEDMAAVLQEDLEPYATDTTGSPQDIEIARVFYIRIKCILGKRNAGLTTADGYKVIHASGYLKLRQYSLDVAPCEGCVKNMGLVAIGQTLPPSTITELRLFSSSFMFRSRVDSTIVFLDSRAADLTGYDLQELIDKSMYRYIHVDEMHRIKDCHHILMVKGQVTTPRYRFLAKNGGWIWMETQMVLIHNSKSSLSHYVVGINQVLGGPEECDLVMASDQIGQSNSGGLEAVNPVLTSSEVGNTAKRKVPAQQNNSSNSNSSSEAVGLYSEQFYGVQGANLVLHHHQFPGTRTGSGTIIQETARKHQQRPAGNVSSCFLGTGNRTGNVLVSSATGECIMDGTFRSCLFKDERTGEKRYRLRTEATNTAIHAQESEQNMTIANNGNHCLQQQSIVQFSNNDFRNHQIVAAAKSPLSSLHSFADFFEVPPTSCRDPPTARHTLGGMCAELSEGAGMGNPIYSHHGYPNSVIYVGNPMDMFDQHYHQLPQMPNSMDSLGIGLNMNMMKSTYSLVNELERESVIVNKI